MIRLDMRRLAAHLLFGAAVLTALAASVSAVTDPALATNTDLACEWSAINIQCPAGKVISIESAFYGRLSDELCTAGPRYSFNCTAEAALSVVSALCNNLRRCTVQSSNAVFGDPCYGTFKYSQVSYRCIVPNAVTMETEPVSTATPTPGTDLATNRNIACEGAVISIRCPPGNAIRIERAFYGRTSLELCRSESIPMEAPPSCASDTAQTAVESRCNGQVNCYISSSNSVFGDPCPGIHKYAIVSYRCVAIPRK